MENSPAKFELKKESLDGSPQKKKFQKKANSKFTEKKNLAILGKGKLDPSKKGPKKFNLKRNVKKFKQTKSTVAQPDGEKEQKMRSQNDSKLKKSKISLAYFDAVHILRQMSLKKGSINSLIGTLKDQRNIKQVYALAIKVIKNQEIIKQIVEEFPFPADAGFDPLFIEILIADMIFGQKFFVKYRATKESTFVLEREAKMKDFYKKNKDTKASKSSIIELFVRYIRVNQLKISKKDLIEKVTENQFSLKKYSKKQTTFESFMKLALELEPRQFLVDYHFDDILVFRNDDIKSLTDLEIYKDENLFAIQDKSSMLAIEAMALLPGMKVLDACAAPGMKTIAIASRLKNDCILYANDMDPKRYKQMRNFLHKFGVNVEKLSNTDFSQLDSAEYSNLDIILLDPSCSGTGMVRRFDYGERTEEDKEKEEKRVQKLAKFQLALLETALKFKPKKIVYCTCSKLQTENEDVINEVFSNHPQIKYKVIDPMPSWPTRGTGDYDFSAKCLRSDLVSTLTCGFFCCVLQRLEGATDEEEEAEVKMVIKEEPIKANTLIVVKEEEQSISADTLKPVRKTRGKRNMVSQASEKEEAAPMTPRKSMRLRK